MIKLYTTEVIGVDGDDGDRPLFKLRTFDDGCATLTVDTVISPGIVDEFCAALKKAVVLLDLESPTSAEKTP